MDGNCPYQNEACLCRTCEKLKNGVCIVEIASPWRYRCRECLAAGEIRSTTDYCTEYTENPKRLGI